NRALMQLAETYSEVAKTNPNFRITAPGDIAKITQNLSAADKGRLLDQLRQSAGDDFAADVAANMRTNSPPIDVDQARYRQFTTGAQQKASGGSFADPMFETTRAWDKAFQSAIGLDNNLDNIGNLSRRQLNQIGQRWLPRINGAIAALFVAKDAVETGVSFTD